MDFVMHKHYAILFKVCAMQILCNSLDRLKLKKNFEEEKMNAKQVFLMVYPI